MKVHCVQTVSKGKKIEHRLSIQCAIKQNDRNTNLKLIGGKVYVKREIL